MYFITLLLFILVPSLLLRCLNFLLGRSPTTPEFPTDSISTNTPIPPSSSSLEPLVDFPNIQTKPSSSAVSSSNWDFPNVQTKPSSSSSTSNWEREEVLVDLPNIQTKPSSSSSSSNWEYDVFVSFRGADTRNAFTDHLYDCMNRNGIDTFRDTENLPRGKSISPVLLKAIEESTFAVVVLSTNYADSTWCLDELAYILECKKLRGLEVLPVFYHVEPSEIRKQTGNYGKAFAKHEESFKDNREKVNEWRKALKDVADFSGWHVTQERSESEVIQEITNSVSKAVGSSFPQNHLIGMDSRIREVESRLNLGSNDVPLTIGIWGMGGIGKTTLAKEVFNEIREQFHTSGFVSQVRLQSEVEFLRLLCKSFPGNGDINFDTVERGIKLLKKVLYKNKVLIVLDDVDDFKQIKCLAPEERLGLDTWGGGSRLIITTRDRSVWRDFRVPENQIYEVEKLSDEEAYQLLCQNAFKKDNPPDEFVVLSKSFLQYAGGIPLALGVLGAHLRGQNVDAWSEILHRLDDDKDKDIFSVLQISFDGLQETDKKIFLDIACFFNGEDHVRVKKILEGCGFSVKIGIRNLINKSLIKIESNNELWMHDLLRCLGWHIVREESPLPGTRSRLWVDDNAHKYESRRSWRFEDARNVLKDNTGTTAVEGLFLSFPELELMLLNNKDPNDDPFSTMSNLRLLKIYNVNFLDVYFTSLSEKLRLLEWHEFPLESLSYSFTSDQLVEFKMPNSCIRQLWNETLPLRMLILMDLSNCQYLATTPDFSKVPKLERLILEGCKELSKVHPTIGDLQHLVLLNLKGCTSLESLPPSISLKSLQTLILSGCSKLKKFPEIVESMETLSELYLDGTALRELPASIRHLESLTLLNLSDCENLLRLPSVLCSSLTSLKFLYLSLCSSMDMLPENIGCLKHLQELDACYTAIREVPESISGLKNLKLLCFHGCSKSTGLQLPNSFSGLSSLTTLNLGGCNLPDGAIPDDVGYLFSLQSLDLSENNFLSIPESISQLSELEEISFLGCGNLQSLPENPPVSVENVDVRGCPMLTTSHVWKRLASCNGLNIINCRQPEFLDLDKFPLEKLEELDLSNCQHLTKIPKLKKVPYLKKLNLEGCKMLSEIHGTVCDLQHLVLLNLRGCENLKIMRLPQSMRFKVLFISGCSEIELVFQGFNEDLKILSELHLDGTALWNLPTWMHHRLEGLHSLNLRGCNKILTIPNFLKLESLNLSDCSHISELVNLGSLKHLEELDASETTITEVPQSILNLDKLKVLSFSGCKGLQLPNWFSDLSSLRSLNLRRCGLAEVQVRDIICRLSSLQRLDLSENSFESIPNEIGLLSSLQLLNLSENNFLSIPESIITQLSELTELGLFRCGKLQLLPKKFPFNLKLVDARDCPMLKKYADTLTIWDCGRGFCVIYCGKSDQDDDQTHHVPLPEDSIELLFPKYIKDHIYGEKPFEIRIPHSTRIPNLCSHWTSGPCVKIQLSDSNSAWMGFALFVVFEILQKDDFDKSWELEETICNFHTHGYENPLVFQNFIDFRVGSSYLLCCYEPRGGQFGELLDKASARFGASITTKRPDLKVRGCAIHLIKSQQDAAEFVQNLTNQTVADQRLDFNFRRHCEEILHETTTGDLMELDHDLQELGSTSTMNQDSCSKSNSTQPRGELSKFYEGRNGRERSFHFCFPAPVISIPPWFLNHHAGDVTLRYITENLLDDQTWLGLELYVVFDRLTSATSEGDTSFFFHVDLCAHDHGSLVMHGSLKIDSCLGTSDQLVVLHVPRVHFQHVQLNQCQGISALFRTINPKMEVIVCGSRFVFEQDLEDLIHSLTAVAVISGLEEQHFVAQLCSQAQICMLPEDPLHESQTVDGHRYKKREIVQTVDQRNEVEGINCESSSQRSNAQVLVEEAPPSSITRLRNYRCYLPQKQGFEESEDLATPLVHSRSAILVHSKGGRILENRDRTSFAGEDTTSWLSCDHVRIMAETLFYGSYSLQQWQRCLWLLHKYSKAATLSLGGHTISGVKSFNPSSTYNICFYAYSSLLWSTPGCNTTSVVEPRVGMDLPPKLCDDNDWRGLVVSAVLRQSNDGRTPTTSSSSRAVKLACHLRSNDYCLNPMPTCFITADKFFDYEEGSKSARLNWVTFIPRALLTEFNVLSAVEARIYINCPGLAVHTCSISLLYQKEVEKFQKFITDSWTSFFEKLPLIRQLVDADDDQNVHQRRPHIKDFDRDLIYNTTFPPNKILESFGECRKIHELGTIALQLPTSPSLCSDQDWIGLALWANFRSGPCPNDNYTYTCRLNPKKIDLFNYHQYKTTNEECHPDGHVIWLSYIPRRWFLHQLNGESVLFASFDERRQLPNMVDHRFVYEHNVEEFKQLCIDLHQVHD